MRLMCPSKSSKAKVACTVSGEKEQEVKLERWLGPDLVLPARGREDRAYPCWWGATDLV